MTVLASRMQSREITSLVLSERWQLRRRAQVVLGLKQKGSHHVALKRVRESSLLSEGILRSLTDQEWMRDLRQTLLGVGLSQGPWQLISSLISNS